MHALDFISLAVSGLIFVYLMYALIYPERF